MKDCLFCKIANKEEPSQIAWEDKGFIVVENKYKTAPIHLLIIPKIHYDKNNTLLGNEFNVWESFFKVQKQVVEELKISPNYQLLINAPGYAHFDHEHMHIIAGLEKPLG